MEAFHAETGKKTQVQDDEMQPESSEGIQHLMDYMEGTVSQGSNTDPQGDTKDSKPSFAQPRFQESSVTESDADIASLDAGPRGNGTTSQSQRAVTREFLKRMN